MKTTVSICCRDCTESEGQTKFDDIRKKLKPIADIEISGSFIGRMKIDEPLTGDKPNDG